MIEKKEKKKCLKSTDIMKEKIRMQFLLKWTYQITSLCTMQLVSTECFILKVPKRENFYLAFFIFYMGLNSTYRSRRQSRQESGILF